MEPARQPASQFTQCHLRCKQQQSTTHPSPVFVELQLALAAKRVAVLGIKTEEKVMQALQQHAVVPSMLQ